MDVRHSLQDFASNDSRLVVGDGTADVCSDGDLECVQRRVWGRTSRGGCDYLSLVAFLPSTDQSDIVHATGLSGLFDQVGDLDVVAEALAVDPCSEDRVEVRLDVCCR